MLQKKQVPMRLINLIDSVSEMNFGIWNSVMVNREHLSDLGIKSEFWYPKGPDSLKGVETKELKSLSITSVEQTISDHKLDPAKDIVVTHGLWNFPSRWGYAFRKKGFRWIYIPHGMLEPWPLQQKWLKKKLYFNLFEKGIAVHADIIRAVSKPEAHNLSVKFPGKKIEFIPNGVAVDPKGIIHRTKSIKKYLFLSRLHHKKNIFNLATAWVESKLNNDPGFELQVAGPDQGELEKLRSVMGRSSNIRYLGPVFGEAKNQLIRDADFYVLPSFSEGLPSALLEAMAGGLVPIITKECNFPEVGEQNLGAICTTSKQNIRQILEESYAWDNDIMKDKSYRSHKLILEEYSLDAITKKQIRIYFEGMKTDEGL